MGRPVASRASARDNAPMVAATRPASTARPTTIVQIGESVFRAVGAVVTSQGYGEMRSTPPPVR
ncbi:Uncharacterised protein [Mycobacteroides abscessus subsp. abscessus]|nr:Uncharacterised protein [Mycobacteroides abscessus subsp. abscessus]